MPITQDRMRAAIDAGQDYQQGLRRACSAVRHAVENVENGASPLSELIGLQSQIFEDGLLAHPSTSATTLALEAKHFKERWKDNVRRKEKLRRKRYGEEAGDTRLLAITTAPSSVIPERVVTELRAASPEAGLKFQFRGISPEDQASIDKLVEQEVLGQEWLEKNQDLLAKVGGATSALMPGQEEIEPDDDLGLSSDSRSSDS